VPIHDWTRVGAGTFHNFHYRWLAAIMDRLNAGVLPDGYFAMAEQSVGKPQGDVVALRLGDGYDPEAGAGGTAVAVARPRTTFVVPADDVEHYARKVNRIAVRHPLGDVAAVIEIVSPGNKSSRSAARTFAEKAADLIQQGVNLLVVDILPPGPRDPHGVHKLIWDEFQDAPFELPAGRPLTVASYQAGPVRTAFVEPAAVGAPLPDMPLFLAGDGYVTVPLDETYQATWAVLPAPLRRLVEPG